MIGIIGGTGLGQALLGAGVERRTVDTPFGAPSGLIELGQWKGVPVAILARHGVGHTLNPSQVPYRANIYALKSLGVTHILASGAVGSLREEIRPRDLVIPDQVIDRTYRRTPTFFDDQLAVHVEFAHPYCERLRARLIEAGKRVDARVHNRGVYVCMEGPAFSTRAESGLHRSWAGDLIGMTSLPEAKLAREAEICYALVALPTDYDCWRPPDPSRTAQALLEEIIGNLKAATANAIALIQTCVESIASRPLEACACGSALSLAVWTPRDRITPEVRNRYGVLLDRFLAT